MTPVQWHPLFRCLPRGCASEARCDMPPVARFLMGAFAVFIGWTLVRALRSGTIFSDGVGYDSDGQPMMFAWMAAIHGIGALLFGWLAAGGDLAGLWRLIGPY